MIVEATGNLQHLQDRFRFDRIPEPVRARRGQKVDAIFVVRDEGLKQRLINAVRRLGQRGLIEVCRAIQIGRTRPIEKVEINEADFAAGLALTELIGDLYGHQRRAGTAN